MNIDYEHRLEPVPNRGDRHQKHRALNWTASHCVALRYVTLRHVMLRHATLLPRVVLRCICLVASSRRHVESLRVTQRDIMSRSVAHVMLRRVTSQCIESVFKSRSCHSESWRELHRVTSCRATSCRVTSCCATSCRVSSCHIMSCYVKACHVMLRHAVTCHGTSCHVGLCDVMPCHVMLRHAMLRCDVMPYHVMLRHAMSGYVTSCRVMSCCVMPCQITLRHAVSCPVIQHRVTYVYFNINSLRIKNCLFALLQPETSRDYYYRLFFITLKKGRSLRRLPFRNT